AGAPGAGKTAILNRLRSEGFSVVAEAATDIIAAAQAQGVLEPWREPAFIDSIACLQKERESCAATPHDGIQFWDRSVVCTAALATYLGHPFSPFLVSELKRIRCKSVFENRVFFIRNLGFITPTEARRISFDESLRFEAIHEHTYRD